MKSFDPTWGMACSADFGGAGDSKSTALSADGLGSSSSGSKSVSDISGSYSHKIVDTSGAELPSQTDKSFDSTAAGLDSTSS